MITAVLFDLDGTLLPMDQDTFIKSYLSRMAAKMTSHGYAPDVLTKTIWKGTGAMVVNDGKATNEEVFWRVFTGVYGAEARKDEPLFDQFYRSEFQDVRHDCGFCPSAKEVIDLVKAKGMRPVLATNPLFPAIATYSRVHWAGLDPSDFALITTYENSSFCKPNPDYYREILGKLNLKAEECLMVGNDVGEDMIARELGMEVFLLTDCLINKDDRDICAYPHGGFDALLTFIRGL